MLMLVILMFVCDRAAFCSIAVYFDGVKERDALFMFNTVSLSSSD